VPPRFVPNNALLVGVGCAVDDGGWPVTDGAGRTSVPASGRPGTWSIPEPR
jgi:hypothetical protein